MVDELDRRRFIKLTGVAGAASIAGCGGDGGDGGSTATQTPTQEPAQETETETETETEQSVDYTTPTETDSALIEPQTLHEWVQAGLVNTDDVYQEDRVSVLRVDASNYGDGHVPGALKLQCEEGAGPAALKATRLEGLAKTSALVPPGSVIDGIIKNGGIGPNTTIVLSGDNPMYNSRAYWVLRYWGFPRKRVKVLNGGPTAYDEEFGLSFETPSAPETGYNVGAFDTPNYELRKGLNEMIQLVDKMNAGESDAAIIDQRGPGQDAKIAGSVLDPPTTYVQGDNFQAPEPWISADEVSNHVFGYDGVEEGNQIITMCHSGFKGTLAFFALDGILGYENAALYDGSWKFSWKQYNGEQDPVPNDAWRTDINGRTEGEITATGLDIQPDLNEELTELAQLESNQVKKADIEYMGGDTSGGGFGCGS